MFSVESEDLNNTSFELIPTQISKPSYAVNETDRIGVKVYANTTRTLNVTVNFQVGNGNASFINAPLQIRHSQLRGLDASDSHPIGAITNLQTELDGKLVKANNLSDLADTNVARDNLGINLPLDTGAVVDFETPKIYGSSTTPISANITQDLTNAKRGQIGKMYHDALAEPTYPATWKLAGEGEYLSDASATSFVNAIYFEWESNTRQVYWITQEAL